MTKPQNAGVGDVEVNKINCQHPEARKRRRVLIAASIEAWKTPICC